MPFTCPEDYSQTMLLQEWVRYFSERSYQEAFNELNAAEYIRVVRKPIKGALSIGQTATMANLGVYYEDLDSSAYSFLSPTMRMVLIGTHQPEVQKLIGFGHELGHVFLLEKTGFNIAEAHSVASIEKFCEYFGLVLAYGDDTEKINRGMAVLERALDSNPLARYSCSPRELSKIKAEGWKDVIV